jgi:protein Hikeshi
MFYSLITNLKPFFSLASNIFSYLSSFAPDSAPQTVPLLKRWLEQFERKLRAQGIGFLARAEAE